MADDRGAPGSGSDAGTDAGTGAGAGGVQRRDRDRAGRRGWVARRMPTMPTREGLAANRWLAPIAHRFVSPSLWRFTRRSVPRGVALGLFAGFIVPLGQIFLAAFLALPARANVPLAVLATLVTNPLTLPFWLVTANRVGVFVLKIDAATAQVAGPGIASGQWHSFGWFMRTAGVTAFGFVVLAVVSAGIGYLVSSFVWRLVVVRKRARRRQAVTR